MRRSGASGGVGPTSSFRLASTPHFFLSIKGAPLDTASAPSSRRNRDTEFLSRRGCAFLRASGIDGRIIQFGGSAGVAGPTRGRNDPAENESPGSRAIRFPPDLPPAELTRSFSVAR